VKQIHSTGNINVVGAELAVSVLLSSLVRRGICPNFVATRGMFSCQYEPPDKYWGTADNKRPKGTVYSPTKINRRPREPKQSGHFQYIRMELCGEGDVEEFLKRQPNKSLSPFQARNLLFQISFALYAAAEKFSLKHYDVKLLNVFLQRMPKKNGDNVNLRYGLGEHIFSLQSSRNDAIIAKLADYGTANVDCVTNGQNVTIAQFTTLENTPPDFLILGDQALQGHGHDCFGLGLCMLHLFTGHAPYEEILEVTCPCNLKKELRRIWENEEETQYSVVRSIVLADVYKNEDGHVIEGEADDTLYDTLYKYLVLFGIPDDSSALLNSKVMAAVKTTLLSEGRQKKGRGRNRKNLDDAKKFINDRCKFSLSHGNNQYISRARTSLSVSHICVIYFSLNFCNIISLTY
jgi:serine/threonine protein kinase